MHPFSRLAFLANSIWLWITLFAIIPIASAQKNAPTSPWPSSFKLKRPAKILLISKEEIFIYHTRHFELRSSKALSERHLQKFATIAESVPQALAKIPLPLLGMPDGNRAQVLIFPDEESFVKAGGVAGAAGYYDGRKKAIMLRADTFLMPPPPNGSRLPPKADWDLLVHEFVHLCMHRDLAYLPIWFIEGVAEYFAAAHVNHGVYRFDNIIPSIRDRIKQGIPHEKDTITLPTVSETMALTPQTWRKSVELGDPKDSYRNYASSLLLVHTLFHGGEKRRQTTRVFLNNIQQRKKLAPQVELLIPNEQREKLQKRIRNYWRPRGLRIQFNQTSNEKS